MAETFDELLDLSEFDGQSQITQFVHKDSDINAYNSTWEFVAYSYQRAFEELARKVFEEGQAQDQQPLESSILSREAFR